MTAPSRRLHFATFSLIQIVLFPRIVPLVGFATTDSTLLQAVTFPVAVNNPGLVGEAIQQGRSHGLVAKDSGPVGKAEVTGDHHRSFFVTFGKNLEEQFRSFG